MCVEHQEIYISNRSISKEMREKKSSNKPVVVNQVIMSVGGNDLQALGVTSIVHEDMMHFQPMINSASH